MFGYVMPHKPEMKIKEYEMYRAYYCGLCKEIGRRAGNIPRISLSYDCSFLAMLLSSVGEDLPQVKLSRCFMHPASKRYYVATSEFMEYAADINILLAYYNLVDKYKDEKQLKAIAGLPLLCIAFNKAKNHRKNEASYISECLKNLSSLEKEKCDSLDKISEPFAKILERLFDFEPAHKSKKNIREPLRWLGYNLGKWIYIADAYDDICKDIKNNSYNPFAVLYNIKNIKEFEAQADKIKERARFFLMYCLGELAKAEELLELRHNKDIIDNIVFMGLVKKTEQILKMGSCCKIEKSV